MNQKRYIPGLKNSQKIRVIVNGVGFYTTVKGAEDLCFTEQRVAVAWALDHMSNQNISGYAGRTSIHGVDVDFQVDLV